MTPRQLLYHAMKSKIQNDSFKIRYSDMDALSEMTCLIRIWDGRSPSNRELEGKYINRNASVIFRINTNKNLDGIDAGEEYCEQIFQTMQTLFNYTYTHDNGESITIVKMDAVGAINDLGKNEQGIHRYSLNFNITFGG